MKTKARKLHNLRVGQNVAPSVMGKLFGLAVVWPAIMGLAAGAEAWPRVVKDRVDSHWADDGRWLHYSLVVDQSGNRQSYVVDLLADTPRPTLVSQADPQPAPVSLVRRERSVSGGPATSLKVVNQLPPVVVCWGLSLDGRAIEYQRVKPGESVSQATYAGHVWSLRTVEGDELVRLEASLWAGQVVLTDEVVASYRRLDQQEDRPPRPARGSGRGLRLGPRCEIRDHNLWLDSGDGQGPRALTENGSSQSPYRGPIRISPTGRYVAAVQVERADKRQVHLVESSPEDQLQPKLHSFDYVKPGDAIDSPRLRVFDVSTRQEARLPEDLFKSLWSLTELRWLPEPERLVCLLNERGHQRLRLLAIDPVDCQVQTLVEETSPTFIDYAYKTHIEWLDEQQNFLWMSERSGFNHVLRISTQEDAACQPITSGNWVVRELERVDHQRQRLWFVASGIVPGQDPYYRQLCRVNLDGSDLRVITSGDGDHEWEFSPDRRWLIDRYSRVDLPPVTVLRDAETGREVSELARGDWSDLLSSGWSIPERFVAKGRDGRTDIHGIIVRPGPGINSRRDLGQRLPIVEKIYAGPHGAHVPKAFGLLPQEHELADLGMVVVRIDGMGTNHRGKEFHDVCWKNLADAGFPDRILWIQAAAARYPELDDSRVGIFGGSAGGQNALRALIDHHDFYSVAVADCGCHDNRMDKIWWNEAWMGWPVDDAYQQSSNVVHAAKMQGALMLIVGELDRNVDPASTMQVVDALVQADKDFDLVVIPGQGHGAAETAYGNRRRRDFLVKHLVGAVEQEVQQPHLEDDYRGGDGGGQVVSP